MTSRASDTMDVLYVTKTSVTAAGGGAEQRARAVTGGLAGEGHSVTVVSAKTTPTMEAWTTHDGCEVRHVTCAPDAVLDRPVVGFYAPRYAFALLSIPVIGRLLVGGEYDIVVENMTPYPTLTVFLARLFGVPTVGVVHEFHDRDAVRLYDPLTGVIQLLVQNILRVGSFERLVAPSSQTRDQLVDYGLPSDRVVVVPNGIDPEHLHLPAVEPDPRAIVTVGRLCRRKGQAFLVEAFDRLRAEWPDAELHLVGDGPLRDDLERRVARRDLEAAVTFHGHVPEASKVRLLNEASVFVFGSRQEGFGIAVLEAMAAGTPVVARELPVYRDFFEDGRNGYLVGDSAAEFAAVIGTLLESDERRREIRSANLATAARFSWNRTVEQMEATLEAATGRQGSQPAPS